MKRDINRLSTEIYDLVIIGGGVHGASLAYYASKSGKKVALIEANDFASGSSSAMQRIIHGGLRYLQKADFKRLRDSVQERKRYLQMFPHLIHPLACVVPTKGYGVKSKLALRVALKAYNWLSYDANHQVPVSNKVPPSRVMSIHEYDKKLQNQDGEFYGNGDRVGGHQNKITGGAKWYDGYCTKPERVVIDLLHKASDYGADLANYTQACGVESAGRDEALAIKAHCRLMQKDITIQAKQVVNTAGSQEWYQGSERARLNQTSPHVERMYGFNLVVPRLFDHDDAMGLYGKNQEGNGCMYFVVSQGHHSIIGTHWTRENMTALSEEQLRGHSEKFLALFNESLLSHKGLTRDSTRLLHYGDVKRVLLGSVPAANATHGKSDLAHQNSREDQNLRENQMNSDFSLAIAEKSTLLTEKNHGIKNFYDFYGIKFTTAMREAKRTLNELGIIVNDDVDVLNYDDNQVAIRLLCQKNKIELPEPLIKKWLDHYSFKAPTLVDFFLSRYNGDINKVFECEVDFVMDHEMAVFESDCYLRRMSVDNLSMPSRTIFNKFSQNTRLQSENNKQSVCYDSVGKIRNYYP